MSSECLFCQIVARTVPSATVHEGEGGIAFLDRFPAARGHALVVPRVHAATLEDLPGEAVGPLFLEVKRVLEKIRRALSPTAFNVGWNHGYDAGQRVFHLHVHVIPRYGAGGRGVQSVGTGASGDAGELARIAEAIRAA